MGDAFGRDIDALKQAASNFLSAEFLRGLDMRETASSEYTSEEDSDSSTREEDSDSSDDDRSSAKPFRTTSVTLSFWQQAKSVASGLQELSETFDKPQNARKRRLCTETRHSRMQQTAICSTD